MFSFIQPAAIAAGAASHLFYFKKGEHHLYAVRYLQAFTLSCTVLFIAHSYYGGMPNRVALAATARLAGLYLAGLYCSLIVYRLFFNPLNSIPGPYIARLSKLPFALRNVKLDRHHQLQKLHRKYGRFVRIGPNDLSAADPDGVQTVYGPQSKCPKAPIYNSDLPLISMHTARDRAVHDRQRRIWSPAFSDKALRQYETQMQRYTDLLIKRIEVSSGQPMNLTKWINLYVFDVMGSLAFGHSFNMLESGETHWAVDLLNAGMDPVGFGLPDWLFRFIAAIPGAASGFWGFIDFCRKQMDNRIKMQGKLENHDITHVLIEHFNKSGPAAQKADLPMLHGDSRLIIVAGSDTTATTLVYLFYYLATNSSLIQRLRDELRPLIGKDGQIIHQQIQAAPLLNGCINEALRLNPPVPSGSHRKTPKEGVWIGGTFVPGDTVLLMPPYVMGHDELIYDHCEEFLPERWYSKSDMIKHKDAFIPFSTGPYNCIGKNLAYLEIRLLVAQVIMQFDVALAPGEDGSNLLYKSKDHFTTGLADLNVVFTRRD